MERTFVIARDTRERKPLVWPEHIVMQDPNCSSAPSPMRVRLVTIDRPLPVADYWAQEMPTPDGTAAYEVLGKPGAVVVERKASLSEVATNVFNPKRRPAFERCLGKMRDGWKFPVLLLETSPQRFNVMDHHGPNIPPGVVHDAFQRLLLQYGIGLHFMPSPTLRDRQAIGEWVARLVVNGALQAQ